MLQEEEYIDAALHKRILGSILSYLSPMIDSVVVVVVVVAVESFNHIGLLIVVLERASGMTGVCVCVRACVSA